MTVNILLTTLIYFFSFLQNVDVSSVKVKILIENLLNYLRIENLYTKLKKILIISIITIISYNSNRTTSIIHVKSQSYPINKTAQTSNLIELNESTTTTFHHQPQPQNGPTPIAPANLQKPIANYTPQTTRINPNEPPSSAHPRVAT